MPIVHRRQAADASGNAVDGHHVPVPHFRIVLEMVDWQAHSDRPIAQTKFVIEPCVRLEGEPGEQATMFFSDRTGRAIEMKAFEAGSIIREVTTISAGSFTSDVARN